MTPGSGAVNRAERWLHGRTRALRQWRRDDPDGRTQELLERALAGTDALELAGALGPAEASAWRERLRADAAADPPRPDIPPQTRTTGDALLEDLLSDVPPDLEGGEEQLERFEGALELLATLGAVDAAAWDDRMRGRLGWPSEEEEHARVGELNAGGTEVELVAVLPGADERRGGHRVVVALRFADGISFLLDRDPVVAPELEWPEWRLSDDLGTSYRPGGGGSGDTDEHVTFRTAPPPEARWVELALEEQPDVRFRVAL